MCSSGYHETKLTDDDAIKIAHEYAKTRWSFVAEGNYKVIIGNHSCDFRIYFHRLNKGFITDDYVSAFLTCDGQICGWTYGFENAPRLEERESEIQNIDVEKCKQSIEHFITKKSEKLSKKDCVINSFGDPWVKVSNDGILYCYINTDVTIDGEKESLPMYVEIASGVSKGS